MEEIAIRTAQPLETLTSNSWRPSGFPNKNPRRPVTTVRAGPEGQHPIPDRSQSAHSQVATVDAPTSLPQCAELGPGHQPCHTCHCHSVAKAAAHTETQLQSPHSHQPGLSPTPPCLHARGDSSPDLHPPSRPFSPEHRWPGSWEAAPWGDMGPHIPWDTC